MKRSRFGFLIALGLVFCASATVATAEEMPRRAADHATEALIETREEHAERLFREGGLTLSPSFRDISTEALRQALEAWTSEIGSANRDFKAPKEKEVEVGSVSDLLPSLGERGLRSWKLSAAFEDQPNSILVQRSDAAGGASGGGASFNSIRNPLRFLKKYTLSLSPGQFFLSPDDLKSAYSNLGKYAALKVRFELEREPLQRLNSEDRLRYLARTRKRDWLGRFASSLNLKTATSQRPRLDGGLFLPDDDEFVETFEASFDPQKLLPGPGDLETAYESLKAYADNYRFFIAKNGEPAKDMHLVDESLCAPKTAATRSAAESRASRLDCFSELSKTSGWIRILSVALPVVELGSVDEFDFIKAGGVFYPRPSNREKSLERLSFTWDLQKVFDSISGKSSALNIAKAHREILKTQRLYNQGPPVIRKANPKTPVVGNLYYHRLEAEAATGVGARYDVKTRDDLEWKLVQGCEKSAADEAFPGVRLQPDGGLIGYPTRLGPCEFVVKLSDSFDRKDLRTFHVTVAASDVSAIRAEVARLFSDLTKSPGELATDDQWYEDFISLVSKLNALNGGKAAVE